jgi:hypothetical protein
MKPVDATNPPEYTPRTRALVDAYALGHRVLWQDLPAMPYRLLADAVVVVHLGFVVFVVCGGLLVLWRRRAAFVHLPAAAWGVYIELTGGICPLTPLENRLRALGGESAYSGDFVERYLMPILYPPDLRRDVQVVLGLFALGVNVAIYSYAWRHARRRHATL